MTKISGSCIMLSFNRGPMLTGRIYCGKGLDNPERTVSVIITDQRDPSWMPDTVNVNDEGPWEEGLPVESLECLALLRLATRGYYPVSTPTIDCN